MRSTAAERETIDAVKSALGLAEDATPLDVHRSLCAVLHRTAPTFSRAPGFLASLASGFAPKRRSGAGLEARRGDKWPAKA